MRISTLPVIRCVEQWKIIADWLQNVPDIDKRRSFCTGPMITEIEPETMEKLMALSPVLHINEAEAGKLHRSGTCRRRSEGYFRKSQNTVFVTLGGDGNDVL